MVCKKAFGVALSALLSLSIQPMVAQTATTDVKSVDFLREYVVTATGQSIEGRAYTFASLAELTSKMQPGSPVEALQLAADVMQPADWQRLGMYRNLRLLTVYIPVLVSPVLDSLLIHAAGLPKLEALRIYASSYDYDRQLPGQRRRGVTDTTELVLTTAFTRIGQPIRPFPALQEVRLSGFRLPMKALIEQFGVCDKLAKVELWASDFNREQALPTNLATLPGLTELMVSGRGWLGWQAAFVHLSHLKTLNLFSLSPGGKMPRSHGGNPEIDAHRAAYIADLNRALTYLKGVQHLTISSGFAVDKLRLGGLPQLTDLHMRSSVPSDSVLMGLTRLERLELDEVAITELPATVCQSRSLKTLRLSQNGLTQLPPCLGRLDRLETLFIMGSPFRQLPDWTGSFPQLRSLTLAGCQLDSLPPFVTQWKQLHYLNLGGNLIRSLPDSLGTLRQLDTLLLPYNRLVKLPSSVTGLTQLTLLELTHNQLVNLPDSITSLRWMRHLRIDQNELRTLPERIGDLRLLEVLHAGSRALTRLPESLSKLRRLQQLLLSPTSIRQLPAWIGQLTELTYLSVSSDELVTLPNQLGNLRKLQTLSVSGRRFRAIPESVGTLGQLENLYIRGRVGNTDLPVQGRFTKLPRNVLAAKKLVSLQISDQPYLDVADTFAKLTAVPALRYVGLERNNISALPAINWRRVYWRSLKLTGNKLTALPKALADAPDLQALYTKENPLPASQNQSYHNHDLVRQAVLSVPDK